MVYVGQRIFEIWAGKLFIFAVKTLNILAKLTRTQNIFTTKISAKSPLILHDSIVFSANFTNFAVNVADTSAWVINGRNKFTYYPTRRTVWYSRQQWAHNLPGTFHLSSVSWYSFFPLSGPPIVPPCRLLSWTGPVIWRDPQLMARTMSS